jgi:hypothetical protein
MATTIQDILKRQLDFTNVSVYHKQGYKGKGYVILNAENNDDHMLMTNNVIKDYAPEVEFLNGVISGRVSDDKVLYYYITINGEKLSLEEAIKKYNIKVITKSYSGTIAKPIIDYFKRLQKEYGVIFLCSAGNDGSDGVTGIWAKDDTAIAVGAGYVYDDGSVKRMHYSAIGDEVDFVTFMGRGSGTSSSSPSLASQIVLLLQKYGDFNQIECVEILKSISKDYGQAGEDDSFGHGIPILPLTDRLEVLDKMREGKGEENMPENPNINFVDVKETDWFNNPIMKCIQAGLLTGDGDDTFNPERNVTRAELAAFGANILKLIAK